jgi:hypothetical protein
MGNPGVFLKLPHIPAVFPQGDRDCEQRAAADCTAGGWDVMAGLPLNHRLAQRPLCSVVGGGLDSFFLQKRPERFVPLE